jgi:predicted acyl esterase
MGRKLGIWGVAAAASLVFASSASAFEAGGSVEQVYATGLTPGAEVTLRDSVGSVVETRNASSHGGTLFRNVAPGVGYEVQSGAETEGPLTVLTKQSDPNHPVYNQSVTPDGYGYMEMRDGIKLAYSTHPPSDALGALAALGVPIPQELTDLLSTLSIFDPLIPPGTIATPTLIEYSGYGTADPDGPESGISVIANLLGYTVVDVNMRGTGCSGGAYDFFEPLQGLDGYDIIETVANQPWVKGGKVGMFGISFGGISQLFTAQYQPPSLAAITPLSVIDQTQTTLYPGGLLNTGFAYGWAVDRVHDARPAPDGQPWANDQIAAEGAGSVCQANQALHPEAANLLQKIDENDHYVPEVADPLSPLTFVDKINVPTFMACQWTDEQTGGHCPTLATKMLNGPNSDKKWFTFTNGTHVDSLKPETASRLLSFMEIYVNESGPAAKSPILIAGMPALYEVAMGITGVTPPPSVLTDPILTNPDYASAKQDWEAQKPIRIEYDNGAGDNGAGSSSPGHPYSGFSRDYDSFLAPGTTARSWFFGDDGRLQDVPPAEAAADGFAYDGKNAAATNFTGNTGTGGLWGATPDYQWAQDDDGSAVAYATDPLGSDTTVLGSGAVDVWVRSSEPNVDLEVTISEIRPDGKETFVQGGWMRGDARELDPLKSIELAPVLSLRESDAKPLPADQFVKATIPLYYEGHVYRQGSRIRVRVSAPGGDMPVWSFDRSPKIEAEVAIARGPGMPSRLLLPVTSDGAAPTGLPPCPALRGQPCRDYLPFENESSTVDTSAQGGTFDPATQGGNPGAAGGETKAKRCKKKKSKRKKGAASAKKKKKRCGKKKKKQKQR